MRDGPKLLFGIESYARHMSNEGFQLQAGLESAGYELYGKHFPPPRNRIDIHRVVRDRNPSIAIVQDRREWDSAHLGCFDKTEEFTGVSFLREQQNIFRATIWKDAWFSRSYHRRGHIDLNPHAYIIYYHPDLVGYFSPWIHRKQFVRTYHAINPAEIPPFSEARRERALISGAINARVYPLRCRAATAARNGQIQRTDVVRHPGYGAKATYTPAFLNRLTTYRVAVCTSSVFGCALRKIIEAVACGCVPITDLPAADVLPVIDNALVRVPHDISISALNNCVQSQISRYRADERENWAKKAIAHYDYQRMYSQLADQIATKRREMGALDA